MSGSGLPSLVQALTYWKAVWPIAGVPVHAIAIIKVIKAVYDNLTYLLCWKARKPINAIKIANGLGAGQIGKLNVAVPLDKIIVADRSLAINWLD